MYEGDTEVEREERAIYVIVLAACSPILIALALQPREIDGGNTLVLIGCALVVVGLVAGMRALRRSRIPRARVLAMSVRARPADSSRLASPTASRRAADSRPPLP